jgi:hypothetical protein
MKKSITKIKYIIHLGYSKIILFNIVVIKFKVNLTVNKTRVNRIFKKIVLISTLN